MRGVSLYIALVDAVLRRHGYDVLADSADDVLNRYLAKHGLELVTVERLGVQL